MNQYTEKLYRQQTSQNDATNHSIVWITVPNTNNRNVKDISSNKNNNPVVVVIENNIFAEGEPVVQYENWENLYVTALSQYFIRPAFGCDWFFTRCLRVWTRHSIFIFNATADSISIFIGTKICNIHNVYYDEREWKRCGCLGVKYWRDSIITLQLTLFDVFDVNLYV